MESIQCIFCDISSDQVAIEENGYKGLRCPICGLIYISPRPTMEEVSNLYGHDGAKTSSQSHILASSGKRRYARFSIAAIRKYQHSGKIMDIGAGAGFFLDEARKKGYEPYALELNPVQARFIEETLHIPCEQSPLADNPFSGKAFDVLYHCDVISHFYHPIEEFYRMCERIKDGGLLVFETGNLADIKPKYYKYISQFQYPDHLFFFTVDNLLEILKRTGFVFLEMRRYSIVPQLRLIRAYTAIGSFVKKLLGRGTSGAGPKAGGGMPKPHGGDVQKGNCAATGTAELPPVPKVSRKKKAFLHVWGIVNAFFRYRIGALAPKKGRPQTILVVARKVPGERAEKDGSGKHP